jgi:hypothetical protein
MKRLFATALLALPLLVLAATWRDAFDDHYFARVGGGGGPFPIVNLFAHWKMNDNAANPVVIDSKSNYTGTAEQNTADLTVIGKINSAIRFNDEIDAVNTTTDTNLNSLLDGYHALSVAFWFKETGMDGRCFLRKGEDNNWEEEQPGDFYFFMYSGVFQCFFKSRPYEESYCGAHWSGPTNTLDGAWHHVVLTYDGSGAASDWNLFYEGAWQTPTIDDDTFSIPVTDTSGLLFGGYGPWGQWFTGALDDLRIYNRVLSPSEIALLYNSGAGTEEE